MISWCWIRTRRQFTDAVLMARCLGTVTQIWGFRLLVRTVGVWWDGRIRMRITRAIRNRMGNSMEIPEIPIILESRNGKSGKLFSVNDLF